MTYMDTSPLFGKKVKVDFSDAVKNGKSKSDRAARAALRDLMLFNNILESEMKNMMVAVQSGEPLDHELFDKMSSVKEKYVYAMTGLSAFDDKTERFAFMSLADAIQDLMTYIHMRWRH